MPLAQEDRVAAFRILLSPDARNFLAEFERDGARSYLPISMQARRRFLPDRPMRRHFPQFEVGRK